MQQLLKEKQRELFAQIPPKKNHYVDLTRTDYASEMASRPATVTIKSELVSKLASIDETILSSITKDRISHSKTSAFVDMTADNGTIIVVPKNQDAGDIELKTDALGRQASRNIIILEENSKANITWQNFGAGFLATNTDIVLKQGSELNFSEVQELDDNSTVLMHTEARIHRDAKLQWNVITLGSKIQSVERHIQLLEPGAEGKFVEVFFGNGSQIFDNNLVLGHKSRETSGNVLSNGILTDSARNVFFGLIKIEENAQKTSSFLAQHAMLLSPDAICNSIPSLEIAANDVKASHAASVGQIDKEQIFYLMARGIPEAEAKKLIVLGFLEPALSRIPSDEIKNRLKEQIETKWC
ncbi:MAG: Fe-S cluster assembly protein SufD [Nanoarchaeota archaeon]